jgi:serine/threonine-protein kinase RsbW
VNGAVASERTRAAERVTRLRVADGPLLRPVLCRVVSMALARADWPLDRLEDALLVCDALCAHRSGQAGHERLSFSIEADELQAELRVCELTPESAQELLRDAQLPLVGNVLERVADRVSVESDQNGSSSRLAIFLSAR